MPTAAKATPKKATKPDPEKVQFVVANRDNEEGALVTGVTAASKKLVELAGSSSWSGTLENQLDDGTLGCYAVQTDGSLKCADMEISGVTVTLPLSYK